MRIICLGKGKAKKNRQKKKDEEKKFSYIVVERNRKNERNECPFYTVSNAFLSAIVCRHSLNSIYLKLITVRTERKKRDWERKSKRGNERENVRVYMCACAGARACVCARRKCVEGRSWFTSTERIKIYIDEKTLDDSNLCKLQTSLVTLWMSQCWVARMRKNIYYVFK